MKKCVVGTNEISPKGLTIIQACHAEGSLLPEGVDELPNEPYLTPIIHPLPLGR